MLSTIVLTLIAIWLSIMIIGQLIGGVVGYKLFKSFTSEKEDK
jgi:ABC-type siderophore export system fused ATPase/permease subunit